jgi:peptidoglycan/xylan/chitin deacetylase (PgdA/CDA1 family)
MKKLRWHIKKVSRTAFCVGSVASGSMHARRALGPRCVRVLTYHRFGTEHYEAFSVTPKDFDTHMQQLHAGGRAISLAETAKFINGKVTPPRDACLVTIDDGMQSTLTEAFPILERWRIPAVAFVCSGLIGRNAPKSKERYMTWGELRELSDAGLVTVGSHAHTHRSIGGMDPKEARKEIEYSRELLQDKLGREVTSFAYPFGTRNDFNVQTRRMLAESGYTMAFTSLHGSVKLAIPPLELPRVKVEGGEPPWMFDLISRGGMDAWRMIDNNLWRLQRVRTEIE